jgi:hypothetical protein
LLHRPDGGHCGGGRGLQRGHDCGPKPTPWRSHDDCGGGRHAHRDDHCGAKPTPWRPEHDHCDGSRWRPEPKPDCGCDAADEAGWDGKDKSPSLDRERAAVRFLEQAKETDCPEEKRELIEMALDMLGKGSKKRKDGDSYDKDIVKQAHKMLDRIGDGHLNDCGESKALDSVIDMLMQDGGVDGKPAEGDLNGNGRRDKWEDRIAHMPAIAHHIHHRHRDDC